VRSPAGGAGGGGRALAGGRNSGSRRRSFVHREIQAERVGHGKNGSEKSNVRKEIRFRGGPRSLFFNHARPERRTSVCKRFRADFRLESLGSWCTCRQQFPPKPKPKPDPTMPPGSGSRRRHARPRSWRHATTRRWTPPPQPVAISTRHHFLALSHHSSCSSVTGQESSPSQVPEAEAEAT
jgi:hypothetical protein